MSTTHRILAAGDHFIRPELFAAAAEQRLGERAEISRLQLEWPDAPFESIGNVHEASGSEDALIDALSGHGAILTQLAPLSKRVLEACPELRFIGVSRGGPTNVDVKTAQRLGILVVNVPGRNGIATAEMTLGLLLSAFRRIPLAHTTLMERTWRGDLYRHDQVGREIHGSTVGLIGAGAVGGHVARVLAAMGAHVLVFDPYLPESVLDDIVERVEDLDAVFARSDAISMHARLTPDTARIVDVRRLALMPRGGVLVNAARGGLVDYPAVAGALRTGQLGAAAFDVFPDEPVDMDEEILRLAREGYDVVTTPHVAGASRETAARAADGVAEELRRFLDGATPLHPLTTVAR